MSFHLSEVGGNDFRIYESLLVAATLDARRSVSVAIVSPYDSFTAHEAVFGKMQYGAVSNILVTHCPIDTDHLTPSSASIGYKRQRSPISTFAVV